MAALLTLFLNPSTLLADEAMTGLAAQVAALAADPRTIQVTPATVVAKLRPVVALTGDGPSEAEWTFSGAAPAAGVAWARVYFQAAADSGKWEFIQLQLGLAPSQGQRASFGEALAAEMTKRLGRPKTPASGNAERLRSWSFGKARIIALREGTFTNPIDDTNEPVVLVEIAVAQGERD
ncbi:hypothetical protein PQR75_41115 [Paraburkholderia fungorum]|uniref:hypothetical protein n=1 Tax=Paraburkholderia fungorum TaxID=134537 RepID=UPI0038B9B3CE